MCNFFGFYGFAKSDLYEMAFSTCILHRDLKSHSHISFCNRLLTIRAIILGHGESKKGCLNFCRNRNFSTSLGGIRTHDLRITAVREQNLLPTLYNIEVIFTKTILN